MLVCPACRHELPGPAKYCGFCGFCLAPVPEGQFRSLAQRLEPLTVENPVLLTRVKQVRRKSERFFEVHEGMEQALAAELAAEADGPEPAEERALTIRVDDAELPTGGLEAEGERSAAPSGLDPARSGAAEARRDRKLRRFPLKVEVGYATDHNFYTGFTENLSSGGLFVATHALMALGEVLEVAFTVPGLKRTCRAVAQVQWVRELNPNTPDVVPGMGVRFLELEPAARAAVKLFIQHREPIFYDAD